MSKALDKIKADEGQNWAFVLAIEGYENLITSRADTDAAEAAWSSSNWTSAISGLDVDSLDIGQNIKPWDASVQVPSFRIRVRPDENDTFGKALFKYPTGARTELTEEIQPSSGSLTIHGKDFSDFPSSGHVYIGPERFRYSSRATTTMSVASGDRGQLSPFSADTAADWHFPRPHRLTTDHQAARPVEITQEPSDWIGKYVGLFVHHVGPDGWTSVDDAYLQFAGTITGYEDDSDGSTWLEVEDVRSKVRDAVLHRDQWSANIPEGIRLEAGDVLGMAEEGKITNDDTLSSGVEFFGPNRVNIDIVDIVSDADTEMEAGVYTASDLCSSLSRIFHRQLNNGNLDARHILQVVQHREEGTRVRWNIQIDDLHDAGLRLFASRREVMGFLGFDTSNGLNGEADWWQLYRSVEGSVSGGDHVVYAEYAPMRRLMPWRVGAAREHVITYEGEEGSWVDQSDWLPSELIEYARSGDSDDELGIVRIGERNLAFVARKSGSDELDVLFSSDGVGPLIRGAPPKRDEGDTEDDDGELFVRQILVLEGELKDLLPAMLASQTGNASNHATHDSLEWGAGIPWSLLSDFVDSVASLEEEDETGALTIVLEKPTKLLDVIVPELMLRYGFLLWKNEGLRVVSPPRPSPLEADHVLDHESKAAPVGDSGESFASPSMVTSDHLRNMIKVSYNRNFVDGSYQSHLHIIDQPSVDRWGESPITIEARNSYGEFTRSAEAIDNMAAGLASRMVPVYAHPMRKINRTANVNFWDATPGDTVAVTDPFVRSSVSGERGISNKAGVILRATPIASEARVELEILFADEDRRFLIAPSANVASYDSTDPSITIEGNAFSWSPSKDIDDIDADDWFVIHERNPSDTSSVQQWARQITAKDRDTDKLTLSDTLDGFDSSKKYRVVPRYHADAQSSQRLGSFMADDVDGLIQDEARANLYTDEDVLGFPTLDATRPYESLPDFYVGDGAPVSAALEQSLFDCANNLASHKLAPNMPVMLTNYIQWDADAFPVFGGHTLISFPLFVGRGKTSPFSRFLKVAPLFRRFQQAGAETAEVKVISSRLPPVDDQGNMKGPREETDWFSTTSESFVAPNAKDLPIVHNHSRGQTWVTIVKRSGTEGRFWGLIECRVGEIVV